MKTRQVTKFTAPLTSLLLLLYLLPSLHPHASTFALAQSTKDDEPTCSIHEPSCSSQTTLQSPPRDVDETVLSNQKIISLTDDNFDRLTWTATPSTWLIMFKTDGCGICQKALPVLETLSMDSSIVGRGRTEAKTVDSTEPTANGGSATNGEKGKEDNDDPIQGPIYIATIDASWHGRDTTKRFAVDATPTIIVLRNEGYDANVYILTDVEGGGTPILLDEAGNQMDDTRSYVTYRGQRAQYPLRSFVLGGFLLRNKMTVPPPLPEQERKPRSFVGRVIEYMKPYLSWGGGVVLKLLAGWFIFLGILGLFMRIHNYAWGEDDDTDENHADKREREIEREKAKGASEYKGDWNKDAKIAERQRKMWEKKMENRAKFAARREARKKKAAEGGGGGEDDDDDFVGVGFAVKKSDIQKETRNAKPSKPKSN